jgi:Fe-S cluster biogenesis protein NfuA
MRCEGSNFTLKYVITQNFKEQIKHQKRQEIQNLSTSMP